MLNTSFVSAFILFLGMSVSSQNYFHSTYSWEKNPKVYAPKASETKSEIIIVCEKKLWEYAYDSDGQAVLFETIHNIYHVNSLKAVDDVNKFYISTRNILEEVDLKARCITADNKEIFFNKSSIKNVDNYEDNGPCKIFAIDGVDAGCDVEIIYTNKKPFSYYSYYYVQSRSPVVTFEARIISPKNLQFETKSNNGLANFKNDTSDSKKNHLYLIQHDIAAAENETYAFEKANYNGFAFQLAYNTDRKKSRIYSWDIISRDFHSSLYQLEKSELKTIEKVIDKIKIAKLTSAEEKIKAFDSYLKVNYEINENYENLKLNEAIETKKLSNANGIKFYLGALKYMQVQFELVVTSKRDKLKFDTKFPSYIYMQEFLIFFPEINKYISPLSLYSRLGFPEPDLLNNAGLFIKEVSIGDISTSSSKTKSIPYNNFKESSHNMTIIASLDFTNRSTSIDVTHSIAGYSAFYTQPIYRYLTNEQKKEIHKNYYITENNEGIKDFEVLQTDEKDLFSNPMLVKYKIEESAFLEGAGNKFIFKVGLLIGRQAELYQADKRKWPGDIYFAHLLSRSIELKIPEGYKVTNLDDLLISKSCLIDNKEVALFKSTYELKGDKIIINVYEDYQVIEYPFDNFESFRSVINAAADFNKKSLLFEKL